VHLSASPGSRKPKKGVQNAPKLESGIGTQTAHSKCQMAHIRVLARWHLGDVKTHPFQFFSDKDAS